MGRVGIHIQITPVFLVLLAALVMIVPLRWIVAWFVAVLIHESGHYAMLRILKQQVYSVTFGMGGIRMETDVLSPVSELLSALAGPVLGFCVFPFAAAFPRMVICACIQSAVNLLPVYPLDGGRAVESIIHLLIPKSAEKICRYFRILIGVLAVTAAVYLTFICHSGVLPILCVGLILSKKEKFLANRSFRRYNNRKKLRGCYERTDQKDPADCAETCTVYRRRI